MTSNRSVSNDRIIIDPVFTIPEGAEDEFLYSDEAIIESQQEYFSDGFDDQEAGEDLDIPDGFRVVSQTLRRAPGGQQVVDVVIEVDEVPGAEKYEFQVTKL